MKKKILALVISGFMATSLVACGGAKTAETKAANESAGDTASGEVKTIQSGKLIVATNAEFPPY